MSYDQNEQVDQSAEVIKLDEAHMTRAMPMDYNEYAQSQSNTITETDRYRPSTIQEADTCQEETAANHSSIAYNQVCAFSVGPESKRNQSKQEISSHRILSNRDTNVHTIQEEDRTSPRYEHVADE
jgi:hypothetical protein